VGVGGGGGAEASGGGGGVMAAGCGALVGEGGRLLPARLGGEWVRGSRPV